MVTYFLFKTHFVRQKMDNDVNYIKEKKNKLIERVALNNDVFFYDINKDLMEYKFVHIDHIHYEKGAKKVIAKKYITMLK